MGIGGKCYNVRDMNRRFALAVIRALLDFAAPLAMAAVCGYFAVEVARAVMAGLVKIVR